MRLLHAVAVAGRRGAGRASLPSSSGSASPRAPTTCASSPTSDSYCLRKERTTTLVSVNTNCCTGLPHAADAVMGMLAPRPCCPTDLPADVTVRALEPRDWAAVRRIYAEGTATGHATFETEVPDRRELDRTWLPDHRWVAELDGRSSAGPRCAPRPPGPSTPASPSRRSTSATATAAGEWAPR